MSRLVERKGIDDVIHALAELPDVELVIAGGAPLARLDADSDVRRLRAAAREVGVEERVVFRGRLERHEVPPLLRSADAVVCTPWYEPFGIVPLEAMACGVPVVASAVGGHIDTVVDGVTGLHVPARQPRAIARAVRALLVDDALRGSLGRAGVRRVRERYTWERVASAMLDVYGDVVPVEQAAEQRLRA